MRTSTRFIGILTVAVALAVTVQSINAQRGQDRPAIWADCELYDGIVTPGEFKAGHGPFDELYTGGNGFSNGAPLISDSKPGDMDYNGGRWHLNVLKDTVDPDKYSTACTVEDLDLNDFQSMPKYFECPMIPRR